MTADELSDKETANRRDDVIRRMLNTPPKPFTPKKAKAKKRPRKKATRTR